MGKRDGFLDRISRVLTLAALAVAVIGVLVAPLIALPWAKRPFSGFLMDRTLVVTDHSGPDWTGRNSGVGFRQRVTRIDGTAVNSSADYAEVIDALSVGDVVSLSTETRDGDERFVPALELMPFGARDLFRLFWMPYLMGLAYLSIGAWIFKARGATRPGRALAFFCFAASMSMSLYFDVFSTHLATALWAVAIACLGGALLSLAMRFPQESRLVQRFPSVLAVPYLVSLVLGIWAAVTPYVNNPWQFLLSRDATFRYAGIGGVLFLGTMLFRAFRSSEPVVRRQARIVLLGSLISFAPLLTWMLSPMAGVRLHFEPVIYMPSLVIFPFGVAIAIFRYRLLEMDTIVNRTILWGVLTAVLAGVISVSITILQKVFQSITGEKSDLAVVLTSLILVSVFTPVKTRIQVIVDRAFKDSPEHINALRAFGGEVRSWVQMSDTHLMLRRLLDEAASGMGARSGIISIADASGDGLETVHTYGDWRGEAWVSASLEHAGRRYGLLLLGPREGRRPYTREEFYSLQRAADEVAHAMAVGRKNGTHLSRSSTA